MVSFRFSKRAARAVAVSGLVALLASCAPQAQEQPVPAAPAPPHRSRSVASAGVSWRPQGSIPRCGSRYSAISPATTSRARTARWPRWGLPLALLYREYQAHLAAFTPSDSLLRVVPDESGTGGALVLIEAVAADDSEVLLADLEVLGIQDAALFDRQISGRLPILAIERLAALESLQFAQPVMAATQQ